MKSQPLRRDGLTFRPRQHGTFGFAPFTCPRPFAGSSRPRAINERAALAGTVQSLHARAVRAREELRTVRRERKLCEGRLAALECVISLQADGEVLRAPVAVDATQGVYGERGTLRSFLLDSLEASAPELLDALTLTELVANRFVLPVATNRERKAFADNKLRPALWLLRAQGLFEPLEKRSQARVGSGGGEECRRTLRCKRS